MVTDQINLLKFGSEKGIIFLILGNKKKLLLGLQSKNFSSQYALQSFLIS